MNKTQVTKKNSTSKIMLSQQMFRLNRFRLFHSKVICKIISINGFQHILITYTKQIEMALTNKKILHQFTVVTSSSMTGSLAGMWVGGLAGSACRQSGTAAAGWSSGAGSEDLEKIIVTLKYSPWSFCIQLDKRQTFFNPYYSFFPFVVIHLVFFFY